MYKFVAEQLSFSDVGIFYELFQLLSIKYISSDIKDIIVSFQYVS